MPQPELADLAIRLAIENKALRKAIFGAKSERHAPTVPPEQLELELGEVGTPEDPPVVEMIEYQRKKPKRKKPHPGRHVLPDHLPRKEILIEPEEDTTGMVKIGEEITEALDYTPPKFFVNRYVRPKYAQPDGSGVLTAPMPTRPIEKAIPEAALLALILCDKYLDHLPLYRQVQRFGRLGIKIADSTINHWVAQTTQLLQPLYHAHRRQVLTQQYLQVDETSFKVMDKRKKGKTHTGCQWVFFSPVQRLVLFEYHATKEKVHPELSLKNFQGFLQTDGNPVYDQFKDKEGIVTLNCMAHARRKFFNAGEKRPQVIHALEVFQQLYAIERKAREEKMSPEKRQQLRENEAKPIWNEFQKWMQITLAQLTPKSALAQAISYTLPRWKQLGRYILNGELEIDNNLIENQIRPVALGRKNYLFAGSHNAAQNAAIIYSLLNTCKVNNIDPYKWLKDVLNRIQEHPINKIKQLLPQYWIPSQ